MSSAYDHDLDRTPMSGLRVLHAVLSRRDEAQTDQDHRHVRRPDAAF